MAHSDFAFNDLGADFRFDVEGSSQAQCLCMDVNARQYIVGGIEMPE